MEFSELIKLSGILIVILGFALKLDSILIIFVSALVTALVSGMGPEGLLVAFGKTFVANRSMAIFIMIFLVTGTLERNGLREAAASLINKVCGVAPGTLICIYGIMRAFFAAFNVGFGGVAGFVRPVLLPMIEGAVSTAGMELHEDYLDELKGMSSAMENITWFFFQVLFIGGAGGLLVQNTLAPLGYHVELIDLVKVEIPIAFITLAVACIYFTFRDKALRKKYYGTTAMMSTTEKGE